MSLARALLQELKPLNRLAVTLMSGSYPTALEEERRLAILSRILDATHLLENAVSDTEALEVERDHIRPAALDMAAFVKRAHLQLVRPRASSDWVSQRANSFAVFTLDPALLRALEEGGASVGLRGAVEELGFSPLSALWRRLSLCAFAVFDFRADGVSVAMAGRWFALGVALALGRKILFILDNGAKAPFDFDLAPYVVTGPEGLEPPALARAMRQMALAAPMGRDETLSAARLSALVASFAPPHDAVTQVAFGAFERAAAQSEADPIALRNHLDVYLRLQQRSAVRTELSTLPAALPDPSDPTCFHILQFRLLSPNDPAACPGEAVRRGCAAAARYVRGDMTFEADVIKRIWDGVSAARFTVTDLSAAAPLGGGAAADVISPNVYIELGMAHTLGRPSLMVCAQEAWGEGRLPPELSRDDVKKYRDAAELESIVRDFAVALST